MNKKQWLIIGIVAVVVAAAVAAAFIFGRPGGSAPAAPNATIVTVGSFPITQKDLAYQAAYVVLQYPAQANDAQNVGLYELIDNALQESVLQANGIAVSAADIAAKAKNIDATTQDPQMLAKFKAIYGSDQNAYLNLFVKPILVNSALYANFSQDKVSAKVKSDVQNAIAAIQGGADFRTVTGAYFKSMTVTGIPADQPAPFGYFPDSLFTAAAKLKNGEMASSVVDTGIAYAVVKRISGTPTSIDIWAGVYPKISVGDWLLGEEKKVAVNFQLPVYQNGLFTDPNLKGAPLIGLLAGTQ